jgi:hypothetical protein
LFDGISGSAMLLDGLDIALLRPEVPDAALTPVLKGMLVKTVKARCDKIDGS